MFASLSWKWVYEISPWKEHQNLNRPQGNAPGDSCELQAPCERDGHWDQPLLMSLLSDGPPRCLEVPARLAAALCLKVGSVPRSEACYRVSTVNPAGIISQTIPAPSSTRNRRRTCSRGELPPDPLGGSSCFFSFPPRAHQPSLSEAAVQPARACSTAKQPCPGDTEGKRKGGEKPERKMLEFGSVCPSLLTLSRRRLWWGS